MKQLFAYLLSGIILANTQTICANSLQLQPAKKDSITKSQQKNSYGDEGLVKISSEGQQAAGIKSEILQAKSLPIYISAPGEAIPNKDLTALVTPRVQAQVVQRIVKIGDYVKVGQPLVRLSSVPMAKAQSELLSAYKEWVQARQINAPL